MEEVDSIEGYSLQWPANLDSDVEEVVLLYKSTGKRVLNLVSNYPYELWLDNFYVGDGGLRCAYKEALLDTWPEGQTCDQVVVRLHYMNIEHSSVCFRSLFHDPFFWDLDCEAKWSCSIDHSVDFGAKVCNQLPRQNIIRYDFLESRDSNTSTDKHQLFLKEIGSETRYSWSVIIPKTKRCHSLIVNPKLICSVKLKQLKHNAKNKGKGKSSESFSPEKLPLGSDILCYVKDKRPCELCCDTYDLGMIGLHRFQVANPSSEYACVLAYSEVANFNTAWNTANRKKVRLADCIQKNISLGVPFGFRGCRYVHVIYVKKNQKPTLTKVERREYPFDWKTMSIGPLQPILDACRANLIACVDGGLVDTCWRERTQWVGDVRMAALAIQALTNNTEIIEFVLHQVALSYDDKVGMVAGAFPYKTPSTRMFMPTFHLHFCLCAIENGIMEKDEVVKRVVLKSIQFWKSHYLQNGLIGGMPGWCFIDWDFEDPDIIGKDVDKSGTNSVCNALFHQACTALDIDSKIDTCKFYSAFWAGNAYKLFPNSPLGSIHATAIVLNSDLVVKDQLEKCIQFLNKFNYQKHKTSVTLYFGYFIAKALEKKSREMAMEFIKKQYLPIAQNYGTLYEKHSDEASMAHGWSIGVASML